MLSKIPSFLKPRTISTSTEASMLLCSLIKQTPYTHSRREKHKNFNHMNNVLKSSSIERLLIKL